MVCECVSGIACTRVRLKREWVSSLVLGESILTKNGCTTLVEEGIGQGLVYHKMTSS